MVDRSPLRVSLVRASELKCKGDLAFFRVWHTKCVYFGMQSLFFVRKCEKKPVYKSKAPFGCFVFIGCFLVCFSFKECVTCLKTLWLIISYFFVVWHITPCIQDKIITVLYNVMWWLITFCDTCNQCIILHPGWLAAGFTLAVVNMRPPVTNITWCNLHVVIKESSELVETNCSIFGRWFKTYFIVQG